MKKSKPKQKRYWLNCVEEFILNRSHLYRGYRYFRVEIYDNHRRDGYSIDEATFMVPEELFDALREALDMKEINVLPKIYWPEIKKMNFISTNKADPLGP